MRTGKTTFTPRSSLIGLAYLRRPELATGNGLAMSYHSEDQGRTWVRAHQGLPADSPGVSFLVRVNPVMARTGMPE